MSISTEEIKCYIREYILIAWEVIKRFTKRHESQILCFIVGVLCGLLFLRGGQHRAEVKAAEVPQVAITEVEADAEKQPTNGQKISLYRDVARALYGVRDCNLSADAKRAYIQIMLNRADPNVQYDVMRGTDDLASVLAVPNQWQGYRQDGNYTEADYQLVKEFLESGQGNFLNSDKYYWCEVKQGYVICKADINGKTNIPDQVVQ